MTYKGMKRLALIHRYTINTNFNLIAINYNVYDITTNFPLRFESTKVCCSKDKHFVELYYLNLNIDNIIAFYFHNLYIITTDITQ